MAAYYLDVELTTGDNDGTSWANAWQTIGAITGLAAGDIVFGAMNAAITTVASDSVTWTNGSRSVVIPYSKTLYVCECVATTGWTASSNITISTNSARRYGSASLSVAVGTSFTTGTVAYYNLGSTTDYSSYRNLNFHIYSTGDIASGCLSIRFHDDVDGSGSVVAEYLLPQLPRSYWFALVLEPHEEYDIDTVASISIYAATDPGTPTIYINCMFMSLPFTDADCVDLHTLIGPNNDDNAVFYPVVSPSVDGLTWTIECFTTTAPTANRGGAITTSDQCYRRKGLVYHMTSNTTYFTPPTSGTSAAGLVKYLFGVNPATDEVEGQTIITCTGWIGYGVSLTSKAHIMIEALSLIRFQTGYYYGSNDAVIIVRNIAMILGQSYASIWVNIAVRLYFKDIRAVGLTDSSPVLLTSLIGSHVDGMVVIGCMATWGNNIEISAGSWDNQFIGVKAYRAAFGLRSAGINNTFVNLETAGNTSSGVGKTGGILRLINPVIDESSEYNAGGMYTLSRLSALHHDATNMDIVGSYEEYVWEYDSVNEMWQYTPSSSSSAFHLVSDLEVYPACIPNIEIAQIPVESGLEVTATLKVTKSHATNISCRLMVLNDGYVQTTDAYVADTDTTSEQTLTLTFTPTQKGVVVIRLGLDKYNNSATVKFRDFDFEQATS